MVLLEIALPHTTQRIHAWNGKGGNMELGENIMNQTTEQCEVGLGELLLAILPPLVTHGVGVRSSFLASPLKTTV